MNNLAILSIYTLLTTNTAQANEELKLRYQKYKELESCPLIIKNSTIDMFYKKFLIALNTKELNIAEFENFAEKITNPSEQLSSYLKDLIDHFQQQSFYELITELLTQCHNFSSIYLIMYFLYFTEFKEYPKKLKSIIRFFSQVIYFSNHALFLIKDEKDYPRLYHQAYYSFKNQRNFFDFFLEYPNENIPSLYFNLMNDIKPQIKEPQKKPSSTNIEKFVSLIENSLINLSSFSQTNKYIKDFDNFFISQNDVIPYVDVLGDVINQKKLSQENIVELVLLLFTRCQTYGTLKFSLVFFNFLNPSKAQKNLIKSIEYLAKYPELTKYCCIGLTNNDKNQIILRRIFKKNSFNVRQETLTFFDLTINENILLIMKHLSALPINDSYIVHFLNSANISSLIDNSSLTQKEIDLLSIFLVKCLLSLNEEIMKNKNLSLYIKEFYLHYHQQITRIHLFNIAVLKTFANRNTPLDKEIFALINKNIIYEDDLTYIDEQLENSKFDIDEICLMMEYYDYFPKDKLKNLFFQDYKNYFPFILYFDYEEDHVSIDEIMHFLDKKYVIDKKYLIRNERLPEKDLAKSIDDSFFLMIIADLLSYSYQYYPHLYEMGLSYYDPNIRKLFYKNILSIYQNNFANENILNTIINNINLEKNKDILKQVDNFFKANQKPIN